MVPWVYQAEVNSLTMRTKGAAAATATNWVSSIPLLLSNTLPYQYISRVNKDPSANNLQLFGFVCTQFTPTGIKNIGYRFYISKSTFLNHYDMVSANLTTNSQSSQHSTSSSSQLSTSSTPRPQTVPWKISTTTSIRILATKPLFPSVTRSQNQLAVLRRRLMLRGDALLLVTGRTRI